MIEIATYFNKVNAINWFITAIENLASRVTLMTKKMHLRVCQTFFVVIIIQLHFGNAKNGSEERLVSITYRYSNINIERHPSIFVYTH